MKHLILLISILLTGCAQKTFNKELETKAILEVIQNERLFHVNKKAAAFTDLLSDSFISVNKGEISTPSKKESLQRFEGYFNAVEFEKWDDSEKPIINFSDDGSLAYAIIQKEVIITYPNKEKQKVRESTQFAWIAIYKKYNDKWKLESLASTNKPSEKEIIE